MQQCNNGQAQGACFRPDDRDKPQRSGTEIGIATTPQCENATTGYRGETLAKRLPLPSLRVSSLGQGALFVGCSAVQTTPGAGCLLSWNSALSHCGIVAIPIPAPPSIGLSWTEARRGVVAAAVGLRRRGERARRRRVSAFLEFRVVALWHCRNPYSRSTVHRPVMD